MNFGNLDRPLELVVPTLGATGPPGCRSGTGASVPTTPATPESKIYSTGDSVVSVAVSGPKTAPVVVLLTAAPGPFDDVCSRLHTAALRTVAIGPHRQLTTKGVVEILDTLRVKSAVVVADRVGGVLAWQLGTAMPHRVTGLLVVDVGHPSLADATGTVRDSGCPPAEMNVTAIATTSRALAWADATRRHVYGHYRVAKAAGRRGSGEFAAQLAAETVLLATHW